MSGYKGMRFPSSARIDEWAIRYQDGESATAIALSAGVTHSAVQQGLHRRGIALRSRREAAHHVYHCNEGFFDEITSEERAYWLGFLAADGNVTRYTVSIGLAPLDKDHLYSFVADLGGTQQVETRLKVDGRYVSRVRINSRHMVEALTGHGITPRKSFTLEWPELPPELDRHFLRGYIDGDGSWHCGPSRVGRPSWHVSLVGVRAFLERARTLLVDKCTLRPLPIRPATKKSPHVSRLIYGGNQQVARIARWLYDGATVYLHRKKALADAAVLEAAKTVHGWAAHPDGCLRCGRTSVPYGHSGLCRFCANTLWKHRHDSAVPAQVAKRR